MADFATSRDLATVICRGIAAARSWGRPLSIFRDAAAEPAAPGEVITVFAPKGGAGTTTLATNLGVVLAAAGHRVCVVDLDVAAGDIAISLLLSPVRTLADAVPMAGRLDAEGAASLLTPYAAGGLQVLLAPVTPGDAGKVSAALVAELLGVLRGMFRYVVVDTAAHLAGLVLAAIDLSARLVLLATPDVPALKNLRATQDSLDLLSFPKAARSIVLNRADSNLGLSPEDVLRVLRAPVAARIPYSRAVPLSVNNCMPITLWSGRHPVSRAIARLAQDHLLGASPEGCAPPGMLGRLRDRWTTA
jgi:Flp pilus assembly CpaE family ATPase